MGLSDVLGHGVIMFLAGRLTSGSADLMILAAKEPKRKSPTRIFPLLPLPFLRPGEPKEKPSRVGWGGQLAWQPVPVKHRRPGR
jgi:hypothetical protein